MPASSDAFATAWAYRRYSYAAVAGSTALGFCFPAQAGLLLGLPLAVGMVVLGIAHGACDQLVVPAGPHPAEAVVSGWRYWQRFLLSYLSLAGLVGVLWWGWPAATVGIFFLLTIWHWGSADAPAAAQVSASWWLVHSLLRGLLLFAVPAWWWPAETADIVNSLLTFTGASIVPQPQFELFTTGLGLVVLAGHGVLWARYASRRQWALLQTELVEILVLLALLLALPPRLSVGVYFVFWHSLQHVLRLTGWLGYAASAGGLAGAKVALLPQLVFFLRRAAPLLLVSCAALLVLGRLLLDRLTTEHAWFSLALVVASIVTLPHALLVTVVMDAARWRGPEAHSRQMAAAGPTAKP
ncbi:Brp/Blh family beta-carotene 15,15'-dioxygenase [Hymenobacter elongatus]|uniref:Probable beta-carotene 15,15'-dioxygenase n=1 Tax=Hymenobacter elongatus TaxID=877208 RepID=A0A4Z0PHJ2_9BACT|nr:Brp/Blh family beta-carotene 15,15'-dioxygenase [Hymenobacter elongatus]TGE14469.1 hypothetical protein E5J99_16040 [Hymenobacter elongatus]